MQRLPILIVLACCLVLPACGKKSQPPGGAAAVKIDARPDDGPKLSLKTGTQPVTKKQPLTVAAIGSEVVGDHVYVRARLPYKPTYLSLRGARAGFAFHMDDEVYVRLVGAELPASIEVVTRTTEYGKPTEQQAIRITMAPSSGEVRAIFDARLPSHFGGWGKPAFWQFARVRLEAGQHAQTLAPVRNNNDLHRMMQLYTGSLSAQEALQTDRGLATGGDERAETIALSTLSGPPIAAHPWEDMLKELKKQPSIEPLAARVPADMFYLHFHDIRTLIELSRDLDAVATPALRALEEGGGDARFIERIERDLGLERTRLAETFGNLAVQGVAIVSSDPYFREGNDVTVLFHVKDKGALTKFLSLSSSPARRELDLGDVVAVSNSAGALADLSAVAAGKKPNLAASGEFRYFRALYPFSATDEDGFLFLSDAFVGRTVGPHNKILAARRAQARFDLETVAHATLLYGWLEGARAPSLADVQAARLLLPAETTHFDGSPIDWSIDNGPSSRWGTLAGMTPLIDTAIENVTQQEADAYKQFADTYQRNWKFIDPIGVRIRYRDHRLAVDARMMPLIDFSDYNEVGEMVGEARITQPRVPGVGQISLGIGKEARLRKEIDGIGAGLGHKDLNIGWLGDWAAVGFADRSGVWDGAIVSDELPQLEGGRTSRDAVGSVIARLPLFAMVHIGSKAGLVAALTALRGLAQSTAPGMVEWGPGTKYKQTETVTVRVKEDKVPVAIHYAIVKDVFVIALDRVTLEQQIEGMLLGAAPMTAAPGAAGAVAQSWLSLRPTAGWLTRALAGFVEDAVRDEAAHARDAYEVLARGLPGWPEQGGDAAALRYLGYVPATVHGSKRGRDGDGFFEDSLYGSPGVEKFPDIPVKDSPLAKALSTLKLLEFGISFEGDAKHRTLHTQLTWEQ